MTDVAPALQGNGEYVVLPRPAVTDVESVSRPQRGYHGDRVTELVKHQRYLAVLRAMDFG